MKHFLAQAIKTVNTAPSSSLLARAGTLSDVIVCCGLLQEVKFIFDAETWRALPGMFHSLLSQGSMLLSLVEDKSSKSGTTVCAFCASLFVTESFCQEARTTIPPPLAAEVVRRYLKGTLPILGRDEIATLNARTGLHVMTCFSGKRHDHSASTYLLPLREKLVEAFRLTHSGYNLQEVLCSPIGAETLNWALAAGFRLRRDYSECYQLNDRSIPRSEQRPWLVGLTKEEAVAEYGSRASALFVFTSPRFGFTQGEQALLHRSLAGDTDEEMAAKLHMSHWTVKKRWQSIYSRVTAIDNDLLPVMEPLDTRGAERRRHLLFYLRQHLEELRPLDRKNQARQELSSQIHVRMSSQTG